MVQGKRESAVQEVEEGDEFGLAPLSELEWLAIWPRITYLR